MDTTKKIEPRTILSITILYFLGHFLSLLNRGFWSDGLHLVTLINDRNYSQIWAHLGQTRSYALYYITQFLLSLGGDFTILMKIAGFLAWFVGGITLYIILKKIVWLNDRDSFFISSSFLLFANLPNLKGDFYLGFSLSVTVFFLAVLLYFIDQTQKKNTIKYTGLFVSGILFFASFTTASLLVFYGGFLLFHLYKFCQNKNGRFFLLFASWFKSNLFFILLPIIYWGFRAGLGNPYGELGLGYNQFVFFKPGFLATLFDNTWNFIAYGLFWPIVAPLTILQRRIFAGLLIIISIAVYFLTKKIFCPDKNETGPISTEKFLDLKPLHYIFIGFLWLFLGAFPYLAVGDYPTIFGDGFHMRYAILLPLGASFMILGVIFGAVKEKWQSKIQVALLALFIVFNIYNYFVIDMDWYRQKAIVASLENTKYEPIKNASALIFYENFGEMKSFGRNIKTAEYTLYLHEAFYPKNFKIGISAKDITENQTANQAITASYARFVNAGVFPHPTDFNPISKTVEVAVISEAPHENMTVGMWLKLKKAEMFSDKSAFMKKLQNELQIEVVPVVPEKLELVQK